MTFEDLNLNIPLLKALADLEYVYPTPIQEAAFPVIMSGRNVVGIAQTGTGKTFAYLLPMLRQLPFSDKKDPRILIVAPTRELVIQILNEVQKLTRYTTLRSAGIYGGPNIKTQKQCVYDGLDILVATPGRLIDLASMGVLRLKNVQKVVIDEADEMLGLGFRAQITNVIELLPVQRQTLMFSATLTPEVESLIKKAIPIPFKIEIAPHGTPIEKIIQSGYQVSNFKTKINLLALLLREDPELNKVLIFVATKKLADRLFEQVDPLFPGQFGVIHSNKSHNQRLNVIKQFQEGGHRCLIATDIIARGMDISDVSHVVNFDIPEVPGDYIHRIGRTGRADKAGAAIAFISETEKPFQQEIEQLLQRRIPLNPLPENLVISDFFYEEEKPPRLFDKNYLKEPSIKGSKGAFHEKSEKNKKVNQGGPYQKSARYKKIQKMKIKRK